MVFEISYLLNELSKSLVEISGHWILLQMDDLSEIMAGPMVWAGPFMNSSDIELNRITGKKHKTCFTP